MDAPSLYAPSYQEGHSTHHPLGANVRAGVRGKKNMEVKVTQNELDAIQSCENLQISFLEYDPKERRFCREIKTGVELEEKCKSNKGSAYHPEIFEFVPPNKHQSLINAKLYIENQWKEVKVTVDSGSECTAVTSAALTELTNTWRNQIRANPGCTLSGPAGEQLINLGTINLKLQICGQTIALVANILESEESAILLGSPQIEQLGLGLIPGKGVFKINKVNRKETFGVGCDPSLRDFTGDQDSKIEINGIHPSRESLTVADSESLPSCEVQVRINQSFTVEPWGCREISFSPCQAKLLHGYNLQNFLFRPCLCIIQGKECIACLQDASQNPFQLTRYINGQFQVTFINNKMSPLDIPADFEACVEYCKESYTVEQVARELLEELELDPLVPMFTSQEAREQFDLSYEELKGRLSQIVCEPLSFSSTAIHEPTLAMYPAPARQEPSHKGISMEQYSHSNPCVHCLSMKKVMCDPLFSECVTHSLYDQPLPENPECEATEEGKYSWDKIQEDYKSPQLLIWAVRPGHKNLKNYLATFFGYEGKDQIMTTKKSNVLTLVCELSHRKVIFDSTERLKKVYEQCLKCKLTQIHLVNEEVWGISKYRMSRIFKDKNMKICFYQSPSHLSAMIAWDRSSGEKEQMAGNKMQPQMPPLTTATINPGCPATIGNPELDRVRESPVLKETILCCDPAIEKQTISLLDSYPSLWATDSYGCGSFRDKATQKIVRFDIKFAELEPIVDRPRWSSPAKREAIKEVLGGLIKQGIISPAYSRWRLCPVFVVKKVENISRSEWINRGHSADLWVPGTPDPQKKPKLRLTIDLKKLNSLMTELPMTPTDPRLLVAALQHNRIISTLDCSLAFNSLHLSRAASSVCSHYGGLPDGSTYSHNRLLMGGRQSSCLLAQSLQHALQPCLEYVFLITDDCVILAETETQMLQRLADVLRNLSQAGFRLKRNKAALYIGSKTPTIDIFGLTLNLRTRQIYPIKAQTQEVTSRCIPSTVTQMKSLLGIFAWWHNFLPGHQKHNQILYQMVHKQGKMEWNEERLKSLEWVLDMLVSPMCHNFLPSPNLPFHLAVDSSQYYAGIFLWQQPPNERPRIVGYHAKIYSQREAKCISWEREAFSAIFGIHTFWKYISGRETILYVDSKTSVFVSDYSHSNSKISRYRIFLEGLEWIKVKWVPGSSSIISWPDFLSRRSEQPKTWKNKQVSKADETHIENVSNKLALHYEYSMKQSHFLLDYLLDLSENQIQALPDYSLRMNGRGQIECDLLQSVDHPHQIDLVEKKLQRENLEKSRLEEQQIPKNEKYKNSDFQKSMGEESEILDISGTQKVFYLKARGPEEIKLIDKKWGVNKIKVGSGLQSVMEPQSLDFDELEAIYRPKECAFYPPKDAAPPAHSTRAEKFLYGVQCHSPGLDYAHLSKMQRLDPKFKDIILRCDQDSKNRWLAGDRIIYFTAGADKVLCRTVEDGEGQKRFQLVIPVLFSYDICMVAHRSTRGPAVHATGAASHYGPAKLAKLLSHKLYIPKLSYILTQISQTCQVCLECRRVKRNKPSFFRQMMTVKLPGQGYFLDELQIASNDCYWGFKKVLIAVCSFSNFCICIPIKKQLSQEYLIELLHTNIFMPYGRCAFLVTDQASVMSGNLIQETCSFLNISLNTTPRYSPAANVSELLNSQVLKYLRVQKENYDLTPGSWCLALAGAINMINFSPYAKGEPGVTPASMFFGSNFGVAQNVQPGLYQDSLAEMFESPSVLAIETRKAWEKIQLIHDEKVKKAKEQIPKGPNAGQLQKFSPGDVVICKFRARPNMKYDWKLTRRSKFLFTVVHSTPNTTWIRPQNLASLQRWSKAVDISRRARHPNLTLPCFKTQTIDLTKIRSALSIFSSNSGWGHFKEMKMERPQRDLEMEVLTPILPGSEYMQPELESDILSDYSLYDDDDESQDYHTDNSMYQESVKRAENKVRESGAKIYHYNEMGMLEDEEGEGLKRRREEKYEESGEKEEEEEEKGREWLDEKPILRRSDRLKKRNLKSVTLGESRWLKGERLANLAGYSLKKLSVQMMKKEKKAERKVSFLDWQRIIHFLPDQLVTDSLKDELSPIFDHHKKVFRKLKNLQVGSHPFSSAMSQLDFQAMPRNCNLNASQCSCKKCRDGMLVEPWCVVVECKECILNPKPEWW